ncbi:MAG: response regulator, partial [Acidimicrobiia bacterium]|nr:response regulator [Acidimicrobiia bacterium]
MIRVAIVDDHHLFADGLTTGLQAIPDIEVVATFSDGIELLDTQADFGFDVLLLDLEMPERSGFDVLRSMPASVIAIVVTMHATQE